jgi:hypothetical protein
VYAVPQDLAQCPLLDLLPRFPRACPSTSLDKNSLYKQLINVMIYLFIGKVNSKIDGIIKKYTKVKTPV